MKSTDEQSNFVNGLMATSGFDFQITKKGKEIGPNGREIRLW